MTFESARDTSSQPDVDATGVTSIRVDAERLSAVGRVIDWHRAHEDRIAAQRATYQPRRPGNASTTQAEVR